MFTFRVIDHKQSWEQFIASRPEANFLHSWNWGVFQTAIGKKVFRLGVFDNDQQIGALLVVKEIAKRGNYLAIAGGPIIDWPRLSADQLRSIFEYVKGLAHQEKCLFIRFRRAA